MDISTSQMIAQAVRDAAPFRKPPSAREGLLTRINSENPERQHALTEKLSALETARQSMQQAQQNVGAARKEAARQKIAQIKTKIQALQMMIGDHADSRARKVAQLARELAQAVRAYKAAGGQGAAAAPATTSAPAAATGAASSASADAATTAGAAGGAGQTSVLVATAMPSYGGAAENQAPRQADKDFAKEARGLARQLKNMQQRGDRDDHGANRYLGQVLRGLAGLGQAAVSVAAVPFDVTV